MTKILIDRAVVEQALHVATAAGHPVALIAALRASLADQQEPGFWGRVSARQASRIKRLEATAQQALEFIRTMNQQGWMLADYESDMERTVAGLEAALAEQQEPATMPPFPPVPQWKRGCAVCGIGADGKAYGYVCSRSDCPTRVTCGGTV